MCRIDVSPDEIRGPVCFLSAGWNLIGSPPFKCIDTHTGKVARDPPLSRLKLIIYCFEKSLLENY